MGSTKFDKELWQLFITAKKSILDKNTSKIEIEKYDLDNDGKHLSFQLTYKEPSEIAKSVIKQYFKNAELKESDGIIQFSVSKEENIERVSNSIGLIKGKLEPLFFEVESNPKQEILFESSNSLIRQLLQISDDFVISETLYLTKVEIFDILLPNGFEIEGEIGAIFSISMSFESFKEKIANQIKQFSDQSIFINDWNSLSIKNGYFLEIDIENINRDSIMEIKPLKANGLFSNSTEIYKREFCPTEIINDPYLRMLIYSKTEAKGDKLLYFETFYEINLKGEYENSKDIGRVEWDNLINTLGNLNYYVVPQKGIISFDFKTVLDLEDKINYVNKIENITLNW